MIAIQYSRLKEDKMWLACPWKNFQLQECKKKNHQYNAEAA